MNDTVNPVSWFSGLRVFVLGLAATGLVTVGWLGVYLSDRGVSPYFVFGGYLIFALIVSPFELWVVAEQNLTPSAFRTFLLGCLIVSILGALILSKFLFDLHLL